MQQCIAWTFMTPTTDSCNVSLGHSHSCKSTGADSGVCVGGRGGGDAGWGGVFSRDSKLYFHGKVWRNMGYRLYRKYSLPFLFAINFFSFVLLLPVSVCQLAGRIANKWRSCSDAAFLVYTVCFSPVGPSTVIWPNIYRNRPGSAPNIYIKKSLNSTEQILFRHTFRPLTSGMWGKKYILSST